MAEDLIKRADGTDYGTDMAGNFIHDIIDEDIKNQKYHRDIYTRFPPEPNGYLHIGHCKSICLNAGTALKYGGHFNLRYDDTNPVTEDEEFVGSIENDVLFYGDTQETVIPPGGEKDVWCVLLTEGTPHSVRDLYVTYYLWGHPQEVKFTYDEAR